MKAVDALQGLEELGAMQWGLVTAGQAGRLGVNRVTLGRLSERGALIRLRHGVYSLPSAGFGPLQELRAAWLAVDSQLDVEERAANTNDAVVSHGSAAVVHELGDVVSIKHEFTSPIRRQSSQSDMRFYKADVGDDKVLVEGLPVMSVARTAADLAAAHTDFDHLATIVRDALEGPDLSAERLSAKLTPQAGRYGYADGTELIEACLEKAGLPHSAGQLLKHYPNAIRHAWAPELERILKPMMESMVHKSFLSELTSQQDLLRSMVGKGILKDLLSDSAFTSDAVPALNHALIKRLGETDDEKNRDHDAEDDDRSSSGGTND